MRYIENPPNPWLTHSIDWIGEPPAAKIEVFEETETRTIISSNDSPDVAFDHSINCYRGCPHGCTYCFSRPTHEYLGYTGKISNSQEHDDFVRVALLVSLVAVFASMYIDSALARFESVRGAVLSGDFGKKDQK